MKSLKHRPVIYCPLAATSTHAGNASVVYQQLLDGFMWKRFAVSLFVITGTRDCLRFKHIEQST